MADNTHFYGFRWWQGNSHPCPYGKRMHVATGQDDQDDANNSIDINVGDPVTLLATGGVTVADGSGGTPAKIYGIVVGVDQWYDSNAGAVTPAKKYKNQTSWGTVESRRGYVRVVPASAGIWEIDVDDATTATTLATYRALINSNADHANPGNTTETSADPKLDVSSAAADDQLQWRIVDVSPTLENQDYSGANVKLLVRVNESFEPGMPEDGSITVGI